MPEKFILPKNLETYINTGSLERVQEGTGGSFISDAIGYVPGAIGFIVGAGIGAWIGDFLGDWVAGWFSKKFSEQELRDLILRWEIIPAFQGILTFDNLKATENESRGSGSILDDVYGKQIVSTTEKNTTNDIAGFINSYIADIDREANRLAIGYHNIADWWEIESARLIAEGNTNRETWFAMYQALVAQKLEIIVSRIEEVKGEEINVPPEPEPPNGNGKIPDTILGISSTKALLIGAGIIFLLGEK